MTDKSRISRWLITASMLPWLATAGPHVEAVAARVILARWPRPSLDDPKELPTAWLHCIFVLLLLSVGVSLVVFLVSVARHWQKFRADWRYSAYFATFCIGVATLWIVMHQDPGRVWDWFLD